MTEQGKVPAYAVGLLRDVQMGPEIIAYLEGIDRTLKPLGGRFIIHGGEKHVLQRDPRSDLIVIAFPDLGEREGLVCVSGLSAPRL